MSRRSRDFCKPFRADTTVHLYNHCIDLAPGISLFGDMEKWTFNRICQRYLKKYKLNLMSSTVMGNHFHLILHCPMKKHTAKEAAVAYNNFHNMRKTISENDIRAIRLAKNSNNISEFMREVQIAFSKEFNQTRSYFRQGALWRGTYGSQLIDSDNYAFICLCYIAMNAVRKGYVKNPEDYAFSSYGQWSATGKHPNEKFMTEYLQFINSGMSIEDLKKKMQLNMERLKQLDDLKNCSNRNLQKELKLKLSDINDELREFHIIIQKNFATHSPIIGSDDFKKQHFSKLQELNKSGPD